MPGHVNDLPPRRLPGYADDGNAESFQERLHDATHHWQHFDVLMPVEMRGPMPAVEHELHLAGQFFFDCRGHLRAALPQPPEKAENPRKLAVRIEQLGWIAGARQRPALGQIQMDAEVEGLGRILQLLSACRRYQIAVRAARFQLLPAIQRPGGIGRIAQE